MRCAYWTNGARCASEAEHGSYICAPCSARPRLVPSAAFTAAVAALWDAETREGSARRTLARREAEMETARKGYRRALAEARTD